MLKNGPIVVIDDDEDDQNFLTRALKTMHVKNEVVCFTDVTKSYEYLIQPNKRCFFYIV